MNKSFMWDRPRPLSLWADDEQLCGVRARMRQLMQDVRWWQYALIGAHVRSRLQAARSHPVVQARNLAEVKVRGPI